MFRLFKKRRSAVQFTDELLKEFELVLSEASGILRSSGYAVQANWLKKILTSTLEQDKARFSKLVLSSEFLGGSGSVIDVDIRDKEKMSRFKQLIVRLYHLIRAAGLKDRALNRLKYQLAYIYYRY